LFSLEYNPSKSLATKDTTLGAIFEEIRTVIAPSGLNVLVMGASGTGKEGVAKATHWHSDRKHKPFIAVNCAAIAESLAESELFGHEKGAFTGANQVRKGHFESADGGTIFLDEIGELNPSLQAKLLRVLEENEIMRVGSSKPHTVDVRVIAATNRDLRAMIVQGKFREDLYYRLAAECVHIPSLVERPEDILVLAKEFVRMEAGARHLPTLSISGEVADLLRTHAWPGNVRELKWLMHSAIARHAVLHPKETQLVLADLPRHFIDSRFQLMSTNSASMKSPCPASVPCGVVSTCDKTVDERILELLGSKSSCTIPDLARLICRSRDTVRRSVERLERVGSLHIERRIGRAGTTVVGKDVQKPS
jgi:transcriptional regulator with GAF, ATPase, and Fis domain